MQYIKIFVDISKPGSTRGPIIRLKFGISCTMTAFAKGGEPAKHPRFPMHKTSPLGVMRIGTQ